MLRDKDKVVLSWRHFDGLQDNPLTAGVSV
jgi:hypothetical protein